MDGSSGKVTHFAQTNFRSSVRLFGIQQRDRLSHMYAIGETGVGKSSFLETLAHRDAAEGRGFALIDPHGDLAERLLHRLGGAGGRLICLNAADAAQPYGYNPLRRVRPDRVPVAASGLLETLRKLWPLAWGVRMEHVLRNSLYALLERDGSTLPDILRLYADKEFREAVTTRVRNPVVRQFWLSEFKNYHPRQQAEATAPIQNKLGAILADPRLFRILAAPTIDLHFRQIMDEGKILLVNLSKGHIGEDGAQVLGSILVSTIGLAAFSRTEQPAEERRPFFLHVDEFQNFATLSFVTLMSELRKYGLGLTLAHQYLDQLDPAVLHAVLGNAGTVISFRVGALDAPRMADLFQPAFDAHDLMNLPNGSAYVRLMIDGTPSRPFSMRTIVP